jgi:glutamate-1-semialdehyde 2,1-aminomutase
MNYQERLLGVIPGGAHTYSRGYDQYPANAPQILAKGKGAYVYDPAGRKYLDYGMALRAANIGYAEDEIDAAAIEQIKSGNNLTRPSMIELEAAELMVELIDSVDMVKFTKNGSTAVSAAVKLARAYTGRELVARCADHPFFSYDDWFIASTPLVRGIPKETVGKTKMFRYNDITSLEALISQHPGQFACVILEPATTEEPMNGFLKAIQELCRLHGIVFILDEMITGFRWHLRGAQYIYGVTPDLCTFGKAMANGFAVACVAGRREIMELGSIEFEGRERVFLLSTTHGAEMCGLGAFVASVQFMEQHKVVEHLWEYGKMLREMMDRQTIAHGVEDSFKTGGIACSPYYLTLDRTGVNSLALRTLFLQEMVRNGVLMPWIALSYRHGPDELAITERAFDESLRIYRKALDEGVDKYLVGPTVKPVFRKYN